MKAIALNDDGAVREFAMNDKCAAGTARFYEAMSRTFEMSLISFSGNSGAARFPGCGGMCSGFCFVLQKLLPS